MYTKLYIFIRTFVFRDEETKQQSFTRNTRSTGMIEKIRTCPFNLKKMLEL
jgi:hypothetical protein